ncbi:type II CRISPR-associated endonuclease Cas1 [Pseudostreptobacillus hongkongensis]|uniref:type II CRISPR-associated endonuclease Cas1 n=1 Tax=Pseudostreptobacillus hongkongensis TaxID=1162717 RepID=UPI0028CFFBC5|nr:type II CRISPR-associated endonuclease Cas1 [Pseudostreptobacillus hongkongensis]
MSGWRTVVIKGRSKLDLRYNKIVVRSEEDLKLIHIPEVLMLILETTSISITAALMCELIKQKIKVIFCDEKHNPHFELIPFYGSHDSVEKIKQEISWTDDLKARLWTLIVKEKIKNQMLLLKKLKKQEFEELILCMNNLEYNDVTNREAVASKIYFTSLFGDSFNRKNDNALNSFLNYGYQIIHSTFNREIVANGYLTQLGIFHSNQFNYFNLTSDIMEPFRAIVDELAIIEKPEEIGENEKRKLQNILNLKYKIDGKYYFLSDVIRIYTKSIFDALNSNDINLVKFFENEL